MEFPTASCQNRPKRLKAKTREFAYESLFGKYGEQIKSTVNIDVTDKSFERLSNLEQYDFMIRQIVEKAPIRITENEMVSGSATLFGATKHMVPVTYKGEYVFWSVSHLTVNYKTAIEKGIVYYEEQINKKLSEKGLKDGQIKFLKSLLNVIDCMRTYHARYLQATKTAKPEIYQNLLQVPFKKAQNFYQAVQSLWFIFSFLRLTGNWPGIGRIDVILGDYLENDLKNGTITIKQAREILASFFIKGTEWIEKDTPLGSGDAQHYQNIVLSGIDKNGKDVTNQVTYLVLDIVEELSISDFPITVRINRKTSAKLLNKVVRVIRHGGGTVAIYNEELILQALTDYGYEKSEATNFANDGCWEVQIPGKTYFMYYPFDTLALLQKTTLNSFESVNFSSFEDLYQAYKKDLFSQGKAICDRVKEGLVLDPEKEQNINTPTSVVSLFVDGCIEKARSYNECGPIYNVYSPHAGGVADTVNSLYAIKTIVFDQKLVSFEQFMQVLKDDWKGHETLLNKVRQLKFYGTDNDDVDKICKRFIDDFYSACKEQDNVHGVKFPAGISTFGREIDWAKNRLSAPFGEKQGKILSSNSSPTPGTDTESATAVIKSYCKADLKKMVTGTALDLKLSPNTLDGEIGLNALKQLIKAFVILGGYFVQIDVVDAKTLKKAQQNPKDFKTLSVRVSGWNARFITLTKEWQDMIIQRTEHNG